VALADAAAVAGWPDQPERAGAVARSLVADGLAALTGDQLVLR
jgi:hypothetical protein